MKSDSSKFFLIVSLVLLLLNLPVFSQSGDGFNFQINKNHVDSLLVNEILSEAEDIENLYSLLLSIKNEIVMESYFHGSVKGELNNTQSVTKSIIALLIGKAIDDGYILNEQDNISKYFAIYDSLVGMISTDNLLQMTGGFNWDENKDFIPWLTSTSQVNYILSKGSGSIPGSEFKYNSGAAHLLSVIIERASGIATNIYAIKNLFDPVGSDTISWPTDAEGYAHGSTGLEMRPADMIKIGVLLLNKGRWEGKPVIQADWCDKIFLPQNYVGKKWGDLENIKYGYLWWKAELQGHDICFAWGYAGQFIFLLPQLDAVIVTTSKWRVDPNQAASTEESIIELLSDYIIPFIESRID